jgi:NAD(P)H-dependent flavin oxidoreductase YrpB (nitropropane dioxygenase family)
LAAAQVRHVFTSAGDPALFTARLHDAGMAVVHVVGSLKGALKAADAGVDALVVEGVEGGGFKSMLGASTMVLLPLISERTDLPLLAAGGICDARSAAAALVLGAEGVQMGTRMLASHEAAVHPNFKNAIVAANDDGTLLLNLPGNPTMRACGPAWRRAWPPPTGMRRCSEGSPGCTSTATWTPASPTRVRCRPGSPTRCRYPRSCDARGARSKRRWTGPEPARICGSPRQLAG